MRRIVECSAKGQEPDKPLSPDGAYAPLSREQPVREGDQPLLRAGAGEPAALASLQRLAGNAATVALLREASSQFSGRSSSGLRVGAVSDSAEREADAAAEVALSRLASGTASGVARDEREANDEPIQTALARSARPEMSAERPSVGAEGGMAPPDTAAAIESARGRGRPLPAPVRRDMESAFGANFGAVRVHTDEPAHALSADLGARAFTTGSDIFFARKEFDTSSARGKHVLAHELAHVVQQGGAPASVGRLLAPLDRSINRQAEWATLADLVKEYNAKRDDESPVRLEAIAKRLEPLLYRLEQTVKSGRSGSAATARLQAAKKLDAEIRAERAYWAKYDTWMTKNSGTERDAPGKLSIAAGHHERISDVFVTKTFDENSLIEKEKRLGYTQHSLQNDFVTGISGRFGVRKVKDQVIVPVNIPFKGQATKANINTIQQALDKYWNVFKLTYVSSKAKNQPAPVQKSVKLKFVIGATAAATREVTTDAGDKIQKSPLVDSFDAASKGIDAHAPAPAVAGPLPEHSSKLAQPIVPAPKPAGVKSLTWAKSGQKNAKGVTEWKATEGAVVNEPEVDVGAVAQRFAVKAAHDVLLWKGDHPEWDKPSRAHYATDGEKKTRSDAWNWLMEGANLDETIAHEFGHLIGLPDEYGRSHTDISKITGRDPLAYDKNGTLRPKFEKQYSAVKAAIKQAHQNPAKAADLTATIQGLVKTDGNLISLLSAHHHKLTSKRLDESIKDVQKHYDTIWQRRLDAYWKLENAKKPSAKALAKWQAADADKNTVTKGLQPLEHGFYKWSFRQGFATGGIMGDYTTVTSKAHDKREMAAVHDHKHPLEPRHVKNFADILSAARREVWKPDYA